MLSPPSHGGSASALRRGYIFDLAEQMEAYDGDGYGTETYMDDEGEHGSEDEDAW